MNPSNRIYILDNFRAVVIFLVIVLHTSITYMAFAPEWWYVVDVQNSLFFTAVVVLIDVPIMLILFFIAGYFAFPSLAKRGPTQFLKDKFVRIGLPWLFGVLVLAPPITYLIYFSRNIPVPLMEFWRNDFWGPLYQQAVYWFLGILFLFFVLLSLVYAISPGFRAIHQKTTQPTWLLLIGFVLLMTAGFLTMNFFFPLDTWKPAGYMFMYQPLRAPLYIGYFALGLYAYQAGWFTENGYRPRLVVWLTTLIISGLFYLYYRFTIPGPIQTTVVLKAGNALLFNLFCFSSLLGGAALLQQLLNTANPFWKSLAASSFGIYYLHPLVLFPLALLLVALPLSIFLKAVILIVLTLLLCWAGTALVLKKVPFVRHVF
ncbi:MAG: acyltransferase family protein [Anaerolineae bacterium]|nr:acyltransferase family protein [Anaerolineae bacterium]